MDQLIVKCNGVKVEIENNSGRICLKYIETNLTKMIMSMDCYFVCHNNIWVSLKLKLIKVNKSLWKIRV
jgi:hypothetical protein